MIKKNIQTKNKEKLDKDRIAAKLKTTRRVTEKYVIMEGRVRVAELCLLFTDFVQIFGVDLLQ